MDAFASQGTGKGEKESTDSYFHRSTSPASQDYTMEQQQQYHSVLQIQTWPVASNRKEGDSLPSPFSKKRRLCLKFFNNMERLDSGKGNGSLQSFLEGLQQFSSTEGHAYGGRGSLFKVPFF